MDADSISQRARYWIAGLAFALCVSCIGGFGVWGNPNNAIHYFSVTAAWAVIVMLLVGFGFGAGLSTASAIFGKK
jgi:F0F1-type ATP synthase assembly protein I